MSGGGHAVVTKRLDDIRIKASCSCGAWLVARGSEDGRIIVAWTFNRVCVATDLCWARLKRGGLGRGAL